MITFALTIDAEGHDYLPDMFMFGRSDYVVVEDIRASSLKIVDVYRWRTVR